MKNKYFPDHAPRNGSETLAEMMEFEFKASQPFKRIRTASRLKARNLYFKDAKPATNALLIVGIVAMIAICWMIFISVVLMGY